jgi:hypothetical protein
VSGRCYPRWSWFPAIERAAGLSKGSYRQTSVMFHVPAEAHARGKNQPLSDRALVKSVFIREPLAHLAFGNLFTLQTLDSSPGSLHASVPYIELYLGRTLLADIVPSSFNLGRRRNQASRRAL